ncbi:MAG TPA: SCO family protein [Myxococcaceae bacterium]|nr:SCO family protein [Myxococcaceae bacterium]
MDARPAPASIARPSLQPWLWAGFLALVMGLPVLRSALPAPVHLPPVLGTVPDFRLVDQTGAPFGPAQLTGRVWVADFVFTRCPDVCPRMTERLAGVHRALGDRVDIVSVSVDPEYDTPERLADFARAHAAESAHWHFLTGDSRHVQEAVLRGFKVAFSRESEDIASITHGVHLVLVDGGGRIRGYYDSNDADALERLVADARRLADRPGA